MDAEFLEGYGLVVAVPVGALLDRFLGQSHARPSMAVAIVQVFSEPTASPEACCEICRMIQSAYF
jgi:hypothetical protein